MTAYGHPGDFAVRRWDLEPHVGDQAPLHRHRRGDEAFCVISGSLEVQIGDERTVLEAGDVAVVPAGTAHTFATHGDTVVRVLVVMSPQIDALVEALHDSSELEPAEIWERHESEIVDPV